MLQEGKKGVILQEAKKGIMLQEDIKKALCCEKVKEKHYVAREKKRYVARRKKKFRFYIENRQNHIEMQHCTASYSFGKFVNVQPDFYG